MTTPQPSDTPRADQWADLRALAEVVTPGPWYAKTNIAGVQNLVDMTDTPATFVIAHTDERNSEAVLADLTDYIAAVSPQRVLDLLAALAEAERERDEAQERIEYVTQLNTEKAAALRQAQARIAEVADVAEERGYEVQRLRDAAEQAERDADRQIIARTEAERQVREIREWARRFRVGDVIDPEDLHDLSAALSGVSGPTTAGGAFGFPPGEGEQ